MLAASNVYVNADFCRTAPMCFIFFLSKKKKQKKKPFTSSLDIVLTKNVCMKKKPSLSRTELNLTVDITLNSPKRTHTRTDTCFREKRRGGVKENIKDITSDTLSTIFCVTVEKY